MNTPSPQPLPLLPITAVIITRNAAHQLPACLDSLRFVQEMVVVDSGSEDATVALAVAAGARVQHQDWLGFGPQKQFAVTQAQFDWVLCLDADERISPELEVALRAAWEAGTKFTAYEMPRRNLFMGRWLRYGEGYPDRNLRFFDRRHARWSDHAVHEHVLASGAVGRLHGDLLHESADDLATYIAKQNRYTSLQAAQFMAQGKQAGVWRMTLSPILRFIKFYLIRLGFLDGLPGLTHILIGCMNSHLKYAKLRELRAASKRDSATHRA